MARGSEARPRARELAIRVGRLEPGEENASTDVAGVRVGHASVRRGGPGEAGPVARTGVTAVWPQDGELFHERLYAGVSPLNGYGELTARSIIDEWGAIPLERTLEHLREWRALAHRHANLGADSASPASASR